MYRISNWNSFETARTPKVSKRRSVVLPNSFEKLSFKRVFKEKDALSVFGLFVLLVELCSQHPAPREGWLTEDGDPGSASYTAHDIACMFTIPTGEVQRCLDVLSQPNILWIEKVEQNAIKEETKDIETPEIESGEEAPDGIFTLEVEEIKSGSKKSAKDNMNLKLSFDLFVKYYNYLRLQRISENKNVTATGAFMTWTEARARRWAARCREPLFRNNSTTILKKAFASDFLTGVFVPKDWNPFVLRIEWLIKNEENYTRVLEGYYDNRPARKRSSGQDLVEKNYDE